MAITNRRLVEFDGADFYKTPEWATKALLHYETFSGLIHEPCCGDGAIAEVLRSDGYEVLATDLYDRGYGEGGQDFLQSNIKSSSVVTNPPYAIASDIITKALELADDKVCMLLRTAFLEGSGRYKNLFSVNPPARVRVFSERVSMYPAGQERGSGGTTCFSWFVWARDHIGPTELHWIEPGFKNS